MGQVNINIRMDEELKRDAEELFQEFGMNMTTAFTVFAKTVVRERKIPFEIRANDPFYSPENMKRLKHSMQQLEQGDVIVKSINELAGIEK